MIAAIEWIPAGRANPTPSKYEYSRAEQEFLEKVQAGELGKEEKEDWEDVDDDDNDNESETEDQEQEVEVPAVDPKSLPADLRMDDYSDDEDGEDKVGGLLVGKVRFRFLDMCANLFVSCKNRGFANVYLFADISVAAPLFASTYAGVHPANLFYTISSVMTTHHVCVCLPTAKKHHFRPFLLCDTQLKPKIS